MKSKMLNCLIPDKYYQCERPVLTVVKHAFTPWNILMGFIPFMPLLSRVPDFYFHFIQFICVAVLTIDTVTKQLHRSVYNFRYKHINMSIHVYIPNKYANWMWWQWNTAWEDKKKKHTFFWWHQILWLWLFSYLVSCTCLLTHLLTHLFPNLTITFTR